MSQEIHNWSIEDKEAFQGLLDRLIGEGFTINVVTPTDYYGYNSGMILSRATIIVTKQEGEL